VTIGALLSGDQSAVPYTSMDGANVRDSAPFADMTSGGVCRRVFAPQPRAARRATVRALEQRPVAPFRISDDSRPCGMPTARRPYAGRKVYNDVPPKRGANAGAVCHQVRLSNGIVGGRSRIGTVRGWRWGFALVATTRRPRGWRTPTYIARARAYSPCHPARHVEGPQPRSGPVSSRAM